MIPDRTGTQADLPMVGLTTVEQPKMEMAEKIIGILRSRAENPEEKPERCLAMPELVVRKSTAPAPPAGQRD